MNIIFMGTSAFAVPSLIAIKESHHKILLVIAPPDKPAGRGRRLTPPPVAERASFLGLPLLQPEKINTTDVVGKFKDLKPDCIVIVAFGKILKNDILNLPPKGCVNLHASLLPKYRGAAPINWAIINGERETGLTTMYISEELDAGDILLQTSIPIKETDNGNTLHNILAPLGADLLLKTLSEIEGGKIKPRPQDHKCATYAPILKKEDGKIDWNKGAIEIFNLIRGTQPWPSAYTHLDGKILHIYDSTIIDVTAQENPGTVIAATDSITVAAGRGKLCIKELQLEGKKRMKVRDFLNGHAVKIGTRLG